MITHSVSFANYVPYDAQCITIFPRSSIKRIKAQID